MSEIEPTEKTPPESTPKKGCRGCLGRLAVCLLLLLALLVGTLIWFNGPGFRWLAQKYGPELLAENGFEGDFQLSGTLLKGIQLDTLNLSSETSPLKSLSAKNLRLSYNPLDLKDLKIESITADSLTLDLDLAQSTDEEKKDKKSDPSQDSLAELLAKYRPLATYPKINLQDLNLHVHKGEQNFYQLQQASLSHQAGSETFELQPGTVTDFENQSFQPPLATIHWNEEHFALAQIPLAKNISVPDLELKVEPLFLDGSLSAYDCGLDFSTDLRAEVTALMGPTPLDLQPFLDLSEQTKDSTAKLTQLQATASKLDQEFSQWSLNLSLTLDDNQFQQRVLPQTKLEIIKEDLELDTTLSFELPEQPQQLSIFTNFAPETAQTPAEAWKNSTSDITTELASLAGFLQGISPILNLPAPPDGWPDGQALLLANIGIKDGEPAPSNASLTFNELNWAEATFEKGELTIDYVDSQSDIKADLIIEQKDTSALTSKASFHPETQAYAATFSAKDFNADTLQPFVRLSVGDIPLSGKITLDWQGTGTLPDIESHRGKLTLAQTRLSIRKQTPIQFALDANYESVRNIVLNSLTIAQDDQRLTTNANWNGERIEVPQLSLVKGEQQLVTGRLSAPFALDTDFKNYFTLEEKWQVDLNADRLDIPATCDLLGIAIPEDINGTITLDLGIAGSPANPSLSGKLLLEKFALTHIPQLPPTTARLAWATAGKSLTLDGTLEPEGRNPIVINGTSGFYPKKWAQKPDSFLDEPFNLRTEAPRIDMAPFADLSPKIRRLEGTLALQILADGTYRTPNLTGSLNLDLPTARFDIDRLRRVRQTKLKVEFADNQIRIAPFSTSVDGALLDLNGSINLADIANPSFDLRLNADKALLWRDDNVNARADGILFLKGNLAKARLSGEIGIVESLFYKDIELLPLDVPVSMPKAPTLPSIGKRKKTSRSKTKLPIPEPFANWDLDLQARTTDPFLVRGNLTKGEVTGFLKADGKLGEPQVEGELSVVELSAALPFSTLKIENGKAYFNSKTGFIPNLDIRAQSRIPPYEVDLFVTGSATSPDIVFSSNPPLPENEVITLVATGTTTEGLEDPEAAAGKAFQLLIEQIRRAPPGSALHPLARFAEPLKDVELQVGGVDPFTGKRRNSVTLPVPNSNRWFVSASVDAESNTRGLALYIIKFR